MKKKYIKIILFVVALIILDQITKLVVINYMDLYENVIIIKDFFKFTYITNTGAAFGIFNDNIIFLILISIMLIIYVLREIKKDISNIYSIISFTLILSGAFGNVIDRVFRGYVIDFMSFTILGQEMAIFNVADMYITFGVIILLYRAIKEGKYEKSNSK